MTSVRPIPMPGDEARLSPADLWDKKVGEGLSPDSATKYVATFHGAPPMAPSDATAFNPTTSGAVLPNLARGVRDLAIGAVKAPVESFLNAVAAPSVGESRPDPRLLRGGNSGNQPLNQPPYDAEHGAVTRTQRTQAGIQTAANVAAPAIARIPFAGVPLSGAAVGASYDPEHPVFGAAAGAIAASALHTVPKLLGKAGSAVMDVTGARPESYAGTPTLRNLAASGAKKVLGPLLRDPSEGIGLGPPPGPVMPDALRGEVPELASRRYMGPDAPQTPVTGRTVMRSTARAFGVESAEERSLGMIADAMKSDGLSIDDAVTKVAAQTGQKPETLMDMAGPNVIGLARGASMVPQSRAKADVPQRLFDRSTGQHERLMGDAEELAGLGQPANTRMTLEQILEQRTAAADAAGHGLRQMEPQQLPGLEDIADRPSLLAAERIARGYALEEGKTMAPVFKTIPGEQNPVTVDHYNAAAQELGNNDYIAIGKRATEIAGTQPDRMESRPLSFEEVSRMKRAMDSNSQAARRFGQAQAGPQLEPLTSGEYHQRLMGKTTSSFLESADQAFPGYGDLRKQYGDATSLAKAVEWGKDLLKKSPDDAEVEFKQMGPAEQEMARRGALRALQNHIEGKPEARDVTGTLEPTTMQRRLKLLFGNNYEEFGQRLGREARMNQTRGAIRGQSNTADKIAELAQVTGFSLDDVANMATGNLTGLAKRVLSKTAAARTQGYTQSVANQLSDRLTAGSTPTARDLHGTLREVQSFESNRFLRAAKKNAGSRATSAVGAGIAGRKVGPENP